MSEPFLAEIKMVGFNFPPRGWALCDGQVLPISQNQSLYSLLGNTYGGDGRITFALPDLRGRTPLHIGHAGSGPFVTLGEKGGEENHTLSLQEIPNHGHAANASGDVGASTSAGGNLFGATSGGRRPLIPYGDLAAPVALRSDSIAAVGASQGHNNMQPYLALNFCIALQGLFPSPN